MIFLLDFPSFFFFRLLIKFCIFFLYYLSNSNWIFNQFLCSVSVLFIFLSLFLIILIALNSCFLRKFTELFTQLNSHKSRLCCCHQHIAMKAMRTQTELIIDQKSYMCLFLLWFSFFTQSIAGFQWECECNIDAFTFLFKGFVGSERFKWCDE